MLHNCFDNNNDNTKFYGLSGYEDYIDEQANPRIKDPASPHIVAKCIENKKSKHFDTNTGGYTFYILSTPNNTLFNPIEKYSTINDKRQFHFIDKICKHEWSFKQVNQLIFDKYITFLKTKNVSWLKEAERDLK